MPANAEFLKDIPLFHLMDDEERATIADLMQDVVFPAGHQLFYERDPGGVCFMVRRGRIELSVVDERGEKLVVGVIEPGELCGELSLLDGGDRSTDAVALTEVHAVALRRRELLSFLEKKPRAALELLAALSKRIRRADALLKQRLQNPNELIARQASLGERIADTVASFGGSWNFVLSFILLMAFWIGLNGSGLLGKDPYPFILLNLVLSMLAALQAPIIMMSQNRQDAKDRIRSEADYRVNVRSEMGIAELQGKLDALRAEVVALKERS